MKTLVILAFLALIVGQLGLGLFHLLTDRQGGPGLQRALTRRIVLSAALVGLILLGIATGVVQPHGVLR